LNPSICLCFIFSQNVQSSSGTTQFSVPFLLDGLRRRDADHQLLIENFQKDKTKLIGRKILKLVEQPTVGLDMCGVEDITD
jgi:hypothetical protein